MTVKEKDKKSVVVLINSDPSVKDKINNTIREFLKEKGLTTGKEPIDKPISSPFIVFVLKREQIVSLNLSLFKKEFSEKTGFVAEENFIVVIRH